MELKHIPALAKKASKYLNMNPELEFEELLSESILYYCTIEHQHDPKKAQMLSWLWWSIDRNLLEYVKKEKRRQHEELPNDDLLVDHRKPSWEFTDKIKEWSEDAQKVCSIIFNAPHDFSVHLPKLSRGKIKKMLRKEGWSWPRIYRSFKEIRTALMENTPSCII